MQLTTKKPTQNLQNQKTNLSKHENLKHIGDFFRKKNTTQNKNTLDKTKNKPAATRFSKFEFWRPRLLQNFTLSPTKVKKPGDRLARNWQRNKSGETTGAMSKSPKQTMDELAPSTNFISNASRGMVPIRGLRARKWERISFSHVNLWQNQIYENQY